MTAPDFIKFVEHPRDYSALKPCKLTSEELAKILSSYPYPLVRLGDLTLYCVHYATEDDAIRKWEERKRRIQWDNIVIIMTDRDGCTDDIKERFECLPYRKVMFVHKNDSRFPNCVELSEFNDSRKYPHEVGIVTEPVGWFGRRALELDYDWLALLSPQSHGNPDKRNH